MFITVTTNDNGVASVNADLITHMTVAAFSGNGCKIYLVSKEALSVRDTIEDLLLQISGKAAA